MTEVTVTIGGQPIEVSLPGNDAEAMRQAQLAIAARTGAEAARGGAEAARDVAVASSVQYASAAAAVAGLADGAFGSYLDGAGNPVWGQRTGSTMTPLPGPWISAGKIADASGGNVQQAIDRQERPPTFAAVAGLSFAANVQRLELSDGRTLLRDDSINAAAVAAQPYIKIRSADGKGWRTSRPSITVGTTHVDIREEYGAQPGGTQTVTERLNSFQAAFANAPIGCTVHVPPGDYITLGQLDFTRQMNLKFHGARLIAVPNATNKSAIKVRIVEAVGQPAPPTATDCRDMVWDEVFVQTEGDCLHGVDFQHEVGQSTAVIALLKMRINGGRFAIPNASTGRACRIGGLVNQKHIFTGVEFVNGVWLDRCADGNRFSKCTAMGQKRGFKIDVVDGAFKTLLEDNFYLARDGAVEVFAGSQIEMCGGTIEQADVGVKNQGLFNCSVLFYGSVARQRANKIIGVNFGGGEDVQHNVVVAGESSVGGGDFDLRDLFIDHCTFNTAAYTWGGSPNTPYDVMIANDLVKYVRIGDNNTLRGVGSARGGSSWTTYPAVTTNTLNDRNLMSVLDSGIGTYGVWQAASRLALQNGYTGNVRFRKKLDDMLVFEGLVTSATAGAMNAGTVIGTLPVGFRPESDIAVYAVTLQSGVGFKQCLLSITAAGVISLAETIVTADVRFFSVSFSVKGRASYSPAA